MTGSSIFAKASGSRLQAKSAAKAATAEAWHMRTTSFALLPLTLLFIWIVLGLLGKDYVAVRAELAHPLVGILLLLFLLAGLVHMKIGMQSIILDYVHARHWKEGALMANLFFSTVLGVACIYAVLKLSFV
jgi:succinate dehydrogenase / fumarate reductase membrane anchor subunit